MAVSDDGRRAEGIWRCDCGDSHFLTLTHWKSVSSMPDLEVEGFLAIEGGNRFYTRWRKRVQGAWDLLRGRPAYYSDVILNADSAREAAAVLYAFANDYDSWHDQRAGHSGDVAP